MIKIIDKIKEGFRYMFSTDYDLIDVEASKEYLADEENRTRYIEQRAANRKAGRKQTVLLNILLLSVATVCFILFFTISFLR